MRGNLFEITDVPGFVSSYQQNPEAPNPATFRPMRGVTVHLATNHPFGFGNSFLPSVSIKTNTDRTGAFGFTVPPAIPRSASARLLMFRRIGTAAGVPILGPIYRSESFRVGSISDDQVQRIYVACQQAPNSAGISQADLSKAAREAAKELKLKSLSAFIGADRVSLVAKNKGGTAKFDVLLRPSTAANLDSLLTHKVENMDIDLPGPDFLTGICVDENKIASSIRSGISGLMTDFNARIRESVIQEVARQTGLPVFLVSAVFDEQVSLTFEKIRYPVVEERSLGFLTLKFRAIVPDPCFGLPRRLFA